MDIEEVKAKRTKLESDIAELLLQFSAETSLEIVTLHIRDTVIQVLANGERVTSYTVRADVTL